MSNNSLRIFVNPELDITVRAMWLKGDPWFVAKDVCDVLGTRTSHIKDILDDDEYMEIPNVHSMDIGSIGESDNVSDQSNGGKVPLILSEPGFYTLILRSRKPFAKKFRRWVTHEVLPEIRKEGMYTLPPHVDKIFSENKYLLEQNKKIVNTDNILLDHMVELTKINKELSKDKSIAEYNSVLTKVLADLVETNTKLARRNEELTKQLLEK